METPPPTNPRRSAPPPTPLDLCNSCPVRRVTLRIPIAALLVAAITCLTPAAFGEATAGDSRARASGHPGQAHSFITVSACGQYLCHPDGRPFIPVGHNDWWSHRADSIFRDRRRLGEYFALMQSHGANVLRVLLDGGTTAFVESQVGVFVPESREALDNLFAMAEEHDIYLLVSLLPTMYDRMNFRTHPYNSTLDPVRGVAASTADLLTSPAAIAAFKGRIDYFVENWGGSDRLVAWELWNEFNNTGTPETRATWIEIMGSYIKARELELYGQHHLRTVSSNNAGAGEASEPIYTSPQLDIATYHTYDAHGRIGVAMWEGIPNLSRLDPVAYMEFIYGSARRVIALTDASPRPVLGTEDFGIIYLPPPFDAAMRGYSDEKKDDFFLASAWASFIAGSAGPSLRWPCNRLFPEDQESGGFRALSNGMYKAQLAISQILGEVRAGTWSRERSQARAAHTQGFFVWSLSGGDRQLVFVLDRQNDLDRVEAAPVSLDVQGEGPGLFTIDWYDLRTGEVIKTDRASGPTFTLSPPPFTTFTLASLSRTPRG